MGKRVLIWGGGEVITLNFQEIFKKTNKQLDKR